MSRIVVLGGGIGGLSVALKIRGELGKWHDIVLFSGRMAEPFFERYTMRLLGVQKLKGSV